MKIPLVFVFILLIFFNSQDHSYTLDKEEALNAYNYLNDIRKAPEKYGKITGTDLEYVDPKPALIWNDTLAKVAEKKALDMAERNYYSHTDPDGNGINVLIHEAGYKLNEAWYKNKSLNYFESLGAGYNGGISAINNLILDKNFSPPDHRNHLLGIKPFWSDCKNIGIGFVKGEGAQYDTYICIIIAKHDY